MFSHWQNPNAGDRRHQPGAFRRLPRPHGEGGRCRSAACSIPGASASCGRSRCSGPAAATSSATTPAGRPSPTGVYDFRYIVYSPAVRQDLSTVQPVSNSIPAIVRGVFQVRNIRETDTVPPFKASWIKKTATRMSTTTACSRTVVPRHCPNEQSRRRCSSRSFSTPTSQIDGRDERRHGRPRAVERNARLRPARAAWRAARRGSCFAQLLLEPVRRDRRAGGLRDRRRRQRPAHAPEPRGRQRLAWMPAGRPSSSAPPAARRCCPSDGSWSVVQHDQGSGEVSPLRAAGHGPAGPAGSARSRDQDDRRRTGRPVPPRQPARPGAAARRRLTQLRPAAVDRDAEGALPPAPLQQGSDAAARRSARLRRRLPASSTRRESSPT